MVQAIQIARARELETIQRGSPTPWGPAEDVTVIADGLAFVSTAGHGGYVVSPDRLNLIDAAYPSHRLERFENGPWFEEDCRAAYVVGTFPELFPARALEHARDMLEWLEERRG